MGGAEQLTPRDQHYRQHMLPVLVWGYWPCLLTSQTLAKEPNTLFHTALN